MPAAYKTFSNKRLILEQDLALLGEVEKQLEVPKIKRVKKEQETRKKKQEARSKKQDPHDDWTILGLQLTKPNTSKKKHNKHTDIPSDRDINEAISYAIFDKNRNYVGFTRYEDEAVVDYLRYAGIIKPTEKEFSYDQKFIIDPTIGKPFIHKYKTAWKKIELLISEYPMIGAGCIWICAALISGTLLWFVNRILETYVMGLFS
jgi:hypothetical protein